MEPFTASTVQALARALGLPPIVLDILDGRAPERLRLDLVPPSRILRQPPAMQAQYAVDRIVPVLANGNGDTVLAYNRSKRGFVWYSVEDALESIMNAPTYSWQQILAGQFHFIIEADTPSDDELRELAAVFDFRFLEPLLAQLRTEDLSTFERTKAWLARFRDFIAEQERHASSSR